MLFFYFPGANIFLTSSGLIKLGDFGCSVKLKNNAQTMPGEVNSTLGTAGKSLNVVVPRFRHQRACQTFWTVWWCVLKPCLAYQNTIFTVDLKRHVLFVVNSVRHAGGLDCFLITSAVKNETREYLMVFLMVSSYLMIKGDLASWNASWKTWTVWKVSHCH